MTSETTSDLEPGSQRFSDVHKVPSEWKIVRCPAHVTQNSLPDPKMSRKPHACHEKWRQSKNEHSTPVKVDLPKRGFGARHLVRDFLRRRKVEELVCTVRVTKFAGHGCPNPESKPNLKHRKSPKCDHTAWGNMKVQPLRSSKSQNILWSVTDVVDHTPRDQNSSSPKRFKKMGYRAFPMA